VSSYRKISAGAARVGIVPRLGLVLWLIAALSLPSASLRAQGAAAPEGYVRPEFARLMADLRPQILSSAARHNRPADTGMSDREFAAVIAQLLYNEHFGWAEDLVPLLQHATPTYQELQRLVNVSGVGTDFSVWPANLRPSVAAEIVRGEVPLADGGTLSLPTRISGSGLDPAALPAERDLRLQLSREIAEPQLAVEYLAANLARGARRARHEGVTVDWQVLAAWHNRGIVDPALSAVDPAAGHYLSRAAGYRAAALRLIDQTSAAPPATAV
jgi:hypothetical protein